MVVDQRRQAEAPEEIEEEEEIGETIELARSSPSPPKKDQFPAAANRRA
jgi:hypothetical protein